MNKLLAGTAISLLMTAGVANAGNIVLTGHDDDLHYPFPPAAGTQLSSMVQWARSGSANASLPVLTLDAGSELTHTLTTLGITFTNVNPTTASNLVGIFDPTKYSAFVVASVTSCGGCDNTAADIANITGQAAAIASFFNAGGGIVGLAAAGDSQGYAYVPTAAAVAGALSTSSGFATTPAASLVPGFIAVNGDETHNFFSDPGTGGLSSSYVVIETDTLDGVVRNITIAAGNASTTCLANGTCTAPAPGTPEPGSLSLIGSGLVAAVGLARRKRKTS